MAQAETEKLTQIGLIIDVEKPRSYPHHEELGRLICDPSRGSFAPDVPLGPLAKRVFEKSRFCHISPTMFSHSSFQTAGANPGPRTVSLDLPGLFKHPLR